MLLCSHSQTRHGKLVMLNRVTHPKTSIFDWRWHIFFAFTPISSQSLSFWKQPIAIIRLSVSVVRTATLASEVLLQLNYFQLDMKHENAWVNLLLCGCCTILPHHCEQHNSKQLNICNMYHHTWHRVFFLQLNQLTNYHSSILQEIYSAKF